MTNSSKIAFEYLQPSSNLKSVAESNNFTTAKVCKSLRHFLKTHKESSYYDKISRKFQVEIIKRFLSSPSKVSEFCKEYGFDESDFMQLMRTAVNDTSIIPSDNVADKVFRKATVEKRITIPTLPHRIIVIMAERYVYDDYATQKTIAYIYGICRDSVRRIFNYGIEQGIITGSLQNSLSFKAHENQIFK